MAVGFIEMGLEISISPDRAPRHEGIMEIPTGGVHYVLEGVGSHKLLLGRRFFQLCQLRRQGFEPGPALRANQSLIANRRLASSTRYEVARLLGLRP